MQKLKQPIIAVSAIIQQGDKFLLVERSRPPGQGNYAFPGGKVKWGETLEEAILRELNEETGLTGFSPQLFRLFNIIGNNRQGQTIQHYVLVTYRVKTISNPTPIAGSDARSVGWFSEIGMEKLAVPPTVRECVKAINGSV